MKRIEALHETSGSCVVRRMPRRRPSVPRSATPFAAKYPGDQARLPGWRPSAAWPGPRSPPPPPIRPVESGTLPCRLGDLGLSAVAALVSGNLAQHRLDMLAAASVGRSAAAVTCNLDAHGCSFHGALMHPSCRDPATAARRYVGCMAKRDATCSEADVSSRGRWKIGPAKAAGPTCPPRDPHVPHQDSPDNCWRGPMKRFRNAHAEASSPPSCRTNEAWLGPCSGHG